MNAFQVAVRDSSTTNITTTYSELVAAISQEAQAVDLAFSQNGNLIIGIGPASSEVNHVVAGSSSGSPVTVPCYIPAGARVSIKTMAGTVSTGFFGFTFKR